MRVPKAIQNLMEALERLPGIGSKTAARLTFYLLHVPEVERQRFGRAVLELGSKTAICERCFNICDFSSPADSSPASSPAGETPGVSEDSTPGVKEAASPAGVKESEVEEAVVLCDICCDPNRDQSVICVVEDPLDLMAFERTGKYKGLYHVLHGVIAPLEHIGPEDLKIDELIARLKSPAEEPRRETPGVSLSTPGVEEAGEEAGTYGEQIKEIILATNPSLEGEATAMYIKQLISQQPTVSSRQIKVTRIARGIPTGGDLEYADVVTLTKALEGRQEY